MSNYEQKIIELLRAAGIRFEREKTFSDLKGGRYRYDFWLPDYNAIIEMNGQQHYQQVRHFHRTRTEFLHAQEADRRKISYALANNYTIYCIPYWDLDANLLVVADSLFSDKYRAYSRWKNDEDWKNYCSNEKFDF